mgnify:CR=1 FL=1
MTKEIGEWECPACGWKGDREDLQVKKYYDSVEFWGQKTQMETQVVLCPRCGSEEVEEIDPTEFEDDSHDEE